MIIVSQYKDTIINFKNIEILGIGNPLEDDEGKFKILANTIIENQYVIAKYKTEERAKEVLQEIIDMYKFNRCEAVGQKNAVYKMPED